MNLTKVNGCYSKELYENMKRIKAITDNKALTVGYLKGCVLSIISYARFNAVAKPRFVKYLEGCKTKKEVYKLCQNTIQKAMKYNASKNKKRVMA